MRMANDIKNTVGDKVKIEEWLVKKKSQEMETYNSYLLDIPQKPLYCVSNKKLNSVFVKILNQLDMKIVLWNIDLWN